LGPTSKTMTLPSQGRSNAEAMPAEVPFWTAALGGRKSGWNAFSNQKNTSETSSSIDPMSPLSPVLVE